VYVSDVRACDECPNISCTTFIPYVFGDRQDSDGGKVADRPVDGNAGHFRFRDVLRDVGGNGSFGEVFTVAARQDRPDDELGAEAQDDIRPGARRRSPGW
jgi:hypothetical protein